MNNSRPPEGRDSIYYRTPAECRGKSSSVFQGLEFNIDSIFAPYQTREHPSIGSNRAVY